MVSGNMTQLVFPSVLCTPLKLLGMIICGGLGVSNH